MASGEQKMSHTPGARSSQRGVGVLSIKSASQATGASIFCSSASHFATPARDAHRAEGDDEGHDLEARDQHAVQRARTARARERRPPPRRQGRPAVLEEQGRTTDARAMTEPTRQVDAAADDDERHPDGAEPDDDGLRRDGLHVVGGQEAIGARATVNSSATTRARPRNGPSRPSSTRARSAGRCATPQLAPRSPPRCSECLGPLPRRPRIAEPAPAHHGNADRTRRAARAGSCSRTGSPCRAAASSPDQPVDLRLAR